MARNRGGGHHVTVPVLDQVGHEYAHAVDHSPQVDVEGPFPVVGTEVPTGSVGTAHSGVETHDVDLREAREDRLREETLVLFGSRHIAANTQNFCAARFELGHRRFERAALDIRRHDLHPGPREARTKCLPHSRGGSRDDGGLSIEVVHGALLVAMHRPRAAPAEIAC